MTALDCQIKRAVALRVLDGIVGTPFEQLRDHFFVTVECSLMEGRQMAARLRKGESLLEKHCTFKILRSGLLP